MFGGRVGLGELLIILAVILLLFGATKLPQLARSMGKSVNEFKKGMKEGEEDTSKTAEEKKPEEKK